jgi:hypothetical protein
MSPANNHNHEAMFCCIGAMPILVHKTAATPSRMTPSLSTAAVLMAKKKQKKDKQPTWKNSKVNKQLEEDLNSTIMTTLECHNMDPA